MKIKEKCSCGASFYASGEEATALFKAWVKRHTCPEPSFELHRDFESTSTIGFSGDYGGTGLDLPAKEYDPWEDE
jgi:hypothetical protein